MNTVLYIGDNYITTFSELQVLSAKLTPEMPEYDDILSLFLDGILGQWLEEGEDKEKDIANKIRIIDCSKSNSQIMKELLAILNEKGSSNPSLKPDFSKYLTLKKALCVIGSRQIDITEENNVSIDSNNRDKILLKFVFSVDKIDNESFELYLTDNGERIGSVAKVDLKDFVAGSEKEFLFQLPSLDWKEHNLMLISDDKTIYAVHIPMSYLEVNANGVHFKMIHIDGGTFTMGATTEQGSDVWDNEKPAHKVTLSSYFIGETQVTQELWQAVMGSNPSRFKGAQHPVEYVSWNDCQDFIRRLNAATVMKFRLPTEAEWEFAARGGRLSRGYKYSGSDNLDEVAWYDRNTLYKGESGTHNVKTKRANELGLYDMSGNVLEWCFDWYGSYNDSAQTNPQGPSSGSCRVGRGGSWFYNARDGRSSCRVNSDPGYRFEGLGLRLVLSE